MIQLSDFYQALAEAVARPAAFSVYTAESLWADPHRSKKMLEFHLDPDIDVSSRRAGFIDRSAAWLIRLCGLRDGKRVLDFGCGPGLYTSRLAASGAHVTGIDFSPGSIEYAERQARSSGRSITYRQANYLEYDPEDTFDLVTMIMCDACALGPDQRFVMFRKIADALSSEGRLVLDVYSLAALKRRVESIDFGKDLMDGFWSASPYFGFRASFTYETERVSLDKFTIFEERARTEIYNWLQYFSPESLERELRRHGLIIESLLGNVAGSAYDPNSTEFAVVARKG